MNDFEKEIRTGKRVEVKDYVTKMQMLAIKNPYLSLQELSHLAIDEKNKIFVKLKKEVKSK